MNEFRRPKPYDKKVVPVQPSVWGKDRAGDVFVESSSFAGKEARESRDVEYALDRWEYSREHLLAFIKRFSRGNNELEKMLREVWQTGGGKAFGLKICEFVTENIRDIAYRADVPPFVVVPNAHFINTEDEKLYGQIIRSSSLEEDWIDPRSGVLPSFDSPYEFTQARERNALPECPYIIQERRPGLGCIADIGYSPIFEKVVARISYGNTRKMDEFSWDESRGHFTSATSDSEAAVGIWDAESGAPLAPTVNFGHKSMHPDRIEYRNTFVPRLFSALKKTGIDFGVQIEMVAHPDNPTDISLVQIRPTPEKIFRFPTLASSTPEQLYGDERVLARSPIVNGAFDHLGQAEFFGSAGIDRNSELGRTYEHGNRKRRASGKVGIYDSIRGKDIYIKYYSAPDIYLGGYFLGSDVQITPLSLRPNTRHGMIGFAFGGDEKYNLLDQGCGMVHLHREEIDHIKKLIASDPSLVLHVRSDGLIAEISIAKPVKQKGKMKGK